MKFFRWCETLIEMDMLFFLDTFGILTSMSSASW